MCGATYEARRIAVDPRGEVSLSPCPNEGEMSRQELRRRLHQADPNLKIVSGHRPSAAKERPMQSLPRVLSPEEIEAWGLPEMLPIFPPEQILSIEAKWSKEDLQRMAVDYFLSPEGDKELLVRKLIYVGALDKDGELTGLPVEKIEDLMQVPYVVSDPKKFCCRLCGACAPENLLERGRFLDRIAWLREHYKMSHPGKWGKKVILRSLDIWDIVDKEKLRKYCEEVYGVPVTAEASDYFGRLIIRFIEGFKSYLPLHLINHRGMTATDMYDAASKYFD